MSAPGIRSHRCQCPPESLGLLSLLVLNLLHEQRKLTVEQLSEQLQRDPTLVRRQVEQLLESGLVAGQGQGRGRAYTLSQRVYAAFDREDAYQHQAILTPEEIDQRILDLAGSLKILRRKDVMEALSGLDERQASYALQRLCKQGRLVPLRQRQGEALRAPSIDTDIFGRVRNFYERVGKSVKIQHHPCFAP